MSGDGARVKSFEKTPVNSSEPDAAIAAVKVVTRMPPKIQELILGMRMMGGHGERLRRQDNAWLREDASELASSYRRDYASLSAREMPHARVASPRRFVALVANAAGVIWRADAMRGEWLRCR